MNEPATLPIQQERQPWPLSGTQRGIRAVYVVTLLQNLKSRSLEQIISDIGWPDDEAWQVSQDTLDLIRYVLDEPDDAD